MSDPGAFRIALSLQIKYPSRMTFKKLQRCVSFTRDCGAILGIPIIIGIGIKLHKEQLASLRAVNAAQASQIQFLRETQFDRASKLIKSQRELYEIDVSLLSNRLQVSQNSVSATSNEVLHLRETIAQKEKTIEAFRTAQNALQVSPDKSVLPPSPLAVFTDSPTHIGITWNASSDAGGSGLAGYRIYRNGVLLDTIAATSYSDTGLSPSTQYCYTIVAYDKAGNASSASPTACATTFDRAP